MPHSRTVTSVMLCLVFAFGGAFADKQQQLQEQESKPWALVDLPQIGETLADVNETEPGNNTCPGESYTLGDTYHAAISPAGDVDWVSFTCNLNDVMTLGTDADGGLPSVDTVIELWDATCTNQLALDDDGGPGLFSLIDGFSAPYTGTYNLKIRGFSASSSVGNYIFIGQCTPDTGTRFCPVGRYKASKISVNAEIPDEGSMVTPAIKFNSQPGVIITDVVIDLDIEHTWVGDLIITLRHTSSGGDVKEVQLLNRPGVPQSTFGCAGDLVSNPEAKYYFGSDPSLEPMGEFDCPSVIESACYAVAVENSNGLEIFRNQPKGDGFWELVISDNAAGDLGYVYNWSVHLLCTQPVSVEEDSWGTVKAKYAEE